FLSPSVYNSLTYEGKRIRGRQMVEAMDAAGMDIAVFGNHEFDISESELQSRINESNFTWVSSNSFHKTAAGTAAFVKTNALGSQPFPETYIMQVKDADGTMVKIGIIGINIPFNKAAYVSYTDPLATAEKLYNQLKDSCDAVIAITHQLIKDDILLAQKIPGLTAILGGHEHDRRYEKVGNVVITKAHSNARSAYILQLDLNKKTGKRKWKASLKMIDASVAIDSTTNVIVQKWSNIAAKNYASLGFDAKKIVMQSGEPLEARESLIRRSTTNFSKLIVNAMEQASPDAKVAIVNSGSIRLDDVLQAPVTQYDIIRTLPFGGSIAEVDMKGSLLKDVLEAGRKNMGIGGFLHYSADVFYDAVNQQWTYKKEPIINETVYKVALTDFLLTGGEANLGFLNKNNPGIVKVYPTATSLSDLRSDIRLAIIDYMEKGNL
ncbi:MAG: 5'-nucleotidase C-terminal domain-containing protein, partial [Gloeobacteraceae cyanobacterium ES-bin-316]|nr:5'-nucleotidase C-terminal domain-containing protein [Ferruginibacter sp.]